MSYIVSKVDEDKGLFTYYVSQIRIFLDLQKYSYLPTSTQSVCSYYIKLIPAPPELGDQLLGVKSSLVICYY